MSKFAKHFRTRATPQSQPDPGRSDMVPNSAGGFGFAVDDWTRLERFLVLGSEGGTYYATERKLTIENAQAVVRCITEDPTRAVQMIVDVSEHGRAPKNDAAVFALAIAAGMGTPPARTLAYAALPKVCRIGTHLFQFANAVQGFRGWGRGLRKAIAAWYTAMEPGRLAYQVAKYQGRDGWTHRDLLRLCHAKDEARNAILHWAVKGWDSVGDEPHPDEALRLLWAFERAKKSDAKACVALIRDHGLPRECIPTQHLNDVAIWDALLEKMPLNAMVRNLGKMTSIGLLKPMSKASSLVCTRLNDEGHMRKSRLHPMAVLLALSTYKTGRGVKGSLTWEPVSQVVDALDRAFVLAFGNVVPAGKRTLLALDVSGSMGSPFGGSHLSCRDASAAMAMVVARSEPAYQFFGFSSRFIPLPISETDSLDGAIRKVSGLPFEGTDCALPMLEALRNKWDVDTFQVYTDSETWAGQIHPFQALRQYREQTGIPAKLAVVGMASNGFTIADPTDAGMLDVVGFDTATPNIIADFSRGTSVSSNSDED